MPIAFDDTTAGNPSPIGTIPVTIGSNTYYVENATCDFPINVITQNDGVGSPRRAAGISGLLTGTFTLQMETGSLIPQHGQTVIIPGHYSASGSMAFTASIIGVTRNMDIGAYHLITVTWQKKLN